MVDWIPLPHLPPLLPAGTPVIDAAEPSTAGEPFLRAGPTPTACASAPVARTLRALALLLLVAVAYVVCPLQPFSFCLFSAGRPPAGVVALQLQPVRELEPQLLVEQLGRHHPLQQHLRLEALIVRTEQCQLQRWQL